MNKIIMMLVFLLLFCSEAFSGNPAPYTEEAFNKIQPMLSTDRPSQNKKASTEERLRKWLEFLRSVYAKAGYNYDDTIVKVVNDMRYHPELIPNSQYSVPMITLLGLQMLTSECEFAKAIENLDCLLFFSADTAESINWLRKNREEFNF